MVTGITERLNTEEYFHPQTQSEVSVTSENKSSSNGEPSIVVSKDFILSLLSLAIGKSNLFEGNLGETVDVKI